MTNPFVIIGGDAAGMSAASKIKREQPDAHVIVFERSEHISYSACGMPYWIAGIVESDRHLVVLTPEAARTERGIDVRTGHTVTAIDSQSKTVTVQRAATGATFTQNYDRLLIATGASAVRPPIPGIDSPGVYTLHSLADAQRIERFIVQQRPRRAVVIGGGYIGLQMVEALHERGLTVRVVERMPGLMPIFDSDMVDKVTAHVAEKGVAIDTGASVLKITTGKEGMVVTVERPTTASTNTEPCEAPADMVLVSTGVRPNRELAANAGLRIGETGAIWVDEGMRTSEPSIYAAGDCVEHHHLVLGRNAWIPLATSANKGGRVAGDNMAGGAARFPGIVGTAVVKVFEYTMALTGLTEEAARKSGLFGVDGEWVGSTVITENDRAGYWPGVETIQAKVVFDRRDGRLLGGQLVGKDGVNKRIDILATALHARMTVMDVAWLDLSYAPPYSPVWDPVQVAAGIAVNEVVRR
jgi:NADPH-dependent 2,4-dienoyl-CoA reductase/sulfur reductase-like enzyme